MTNLSEEDEQKRIAIKKEKRRKQEQHRREKKIQKYRKMLQDRYKAGNKDGTLPGCYVTVCLQVPLHILTLLQLKCGRCGMFGHMKTNKSCPVYVGDDEELEREEREREEKAKARARKEKEREERVKEEAARDAEPKGPGLVVKGGSIRISTKARTPFLASTYQR